MRFAFIDKHRDLWPVRVMCRVLEVAASGYDAWRSRGESRQAIRRRRLTRLIQIIHAEDQQRYGSPRIQRELHALSQPCSVNFVARLMRDGGLRAKTKRKFRSTTDSAHRLPVAPNLLERNFSIDQANRVWLTGITFIPTRAGWLYLCTVEDLFSRRIVGWSMPCGWPSRCAGRRQD